MVQILFAADKLLQMSLPSLSNSELHLIQLLLILTLLDVFSKTQPESSASEEKQNN